MLTTSQDPPRATGLVVIPLALLVHNLEEAITVPRALPRLSVLCTPWLGQPLELPSARQFQIALAVVTALGFALFVLARLWPPACYALVVLQGAMALNVGAHLLGALLLRGYAPGVVTAVLLEAPTSVVVFHRLRRAMWISRRQWRLLPILVLLVHGPALLGLLAWARSL